MRRREKDVMHARKFDQAISRYRNSGRSDRAEADIQAARLCHSEFVRKTTMMQINQQKRFQKYGIISLDITTISFNNNDISRLNIYPGEAKSMI